MSPKRKDYPIYKINDNCELKIEIEKDDDRYIGTIKNVKTGDVIYEYRDDRKRSNVRKELKRIIDKLTSGKAIRIKGLAGTGRLDKYTKVTKVFYREDLGLYLIKDSCGGEYGYFGSYLLIDLIGCKTIYDDSRTCLVNIDTSSRYLVFFSVLGKFDDDPEEYYTKVVVVDPKEKRVVLETKEEDYYRFKDYPDSLKGWVMEIVKINEDSFVLVNKVDSKYIDLSIGRSFIDSVYVYKLDLSDEPKVELIGKIKEMPKIKTIEKEKFEKLRELLGIKGDAVIVIEEKPVLYIAKE